MGEAWFLDGVANKLCAGAALSSVIKFDVHIGLVWYPEPLEDQFACKRLSLDRQRYQEGTEDHIGYSQQMFQELCLAEETSAGEYSASVSVGSGFSKGTTSLNSNHGHLLLDG